MDLNKLIEIVVLFFLVSRENKETSGDNSKV